MTTAEEKERAVSDDAWATWSVADAADTLSVAIGHGASLRSARFTLRAAMTSDDRVRRRREQWGKEGATASVAAALLLLLLLSSHLLVIVGWGSGRRLQRRSVIQPVSPRVRR